MLTPEQHARQEIDQLLIEAGWIIQDMKDLDIFAGLGVAVREFPIPGQGEADYLLYVDGKAIGVIEAKKVGETLTGVEIQAAKYSQAFPDYVDCYRRPLPFSYQSTGIETRFTNHLEPEPRSRKIFAFHRPETLLQRVRKDTQNLALLQQMPELMTTKLRPAQIEAIVKLEQSLAHNRPRSLIQMATGSGKTFTACNFIYRLIKFGGAKRILFLVDRGNLGRQTLKEFSQFVTPDDGRVFTDIYNAQYLRSPVIDDVCKVTISTVQRMYSMLAGKEVDEELEEKTMFEENPLITDIEPIDYNRNYPIETFDYIVIDECHRSIYNLRRQVLEYFDAKLIGLTATPSKQTIGFFDNNLVMEYNHERAVSDGVNVDFGVYRIKTEITEKGLMLEKGYYVDKRNKITRKVSQELLDEDLAFQASQLDRSVVVPDQIRTVIRAFRDNLFTEIFPGRTEVPKTLIFAKSDSHAEDIVQIIREEFAKGNDFCQKITYKTTGKKPEDLIQDFRNSYNPRIAVTVDMIATGTDIKPLEVVMFLRDVKSQLLFDQMKGRGVRIINDTDFQGVTPDSKTKTHFIIVDAVGVCETDRSLSKPLDKQPSVGFEKILQAIAMGNTHPDVVSTILSRLSRVSKNFTPAQHEALEQIGNIAIHELCSNIAQALDPDGIIDHACALHATSDPSEEQIETSRKELAKKALKPLYNPRYREAIINFKKDNEIYIDTTSVDTLIDASFSADAKEKAKSLITDFQSFLEENKEELELIKAYYSKSYKEKVKYADLKKFNALIETRAKFKNIETLWNAMGVIYPSKVMVTDTLGSTDYISLLSFMGNGVEQLTPYKQIVETKYDHRLQKSGNHYSAEQRVWLAMMKDHLSTSLELSSEVFDYGSFAQQGGLGRVYQLFGNNLNTVMEEMQRELV